MTNKWALFVDVAKCHNCRNCFIAAKDTGRTAYASPASSSAQRTRVSRASPIPPSGERSNAVMVMLIVFSCQ